MPIALSICPYLSIIHVLEEQAILQACTIDRRLASTAEENDGS